MDNHSENLLNRIGKTEFEALFRTHYSNLCRYEALTYPEIATRLGISVKTVENQMGKALKTLREELSEYLPWLTLFFFDLFRNP